MSLFDEDELLPLSALQHLLFCERRAALVHLEQMWEENIYTVEGHHLHERADSGEVDVRDGVRCVRSIPLVSRRLGLSGRADLVELRPLPAGEIGGAVLPGLPGLWRPYPVETKRGQGRPHRYREYMVQLCAQALCLEEMWGGKVPEGAIFFHRSRRRREVRMGLALRQETETAAARLHQLIAARRTPEPVREPKCDRCSLLPRCLPDAPRRSARGYLARALRQARKDSEGET